MARSFGDICKTKYWLSFQRRPFAWWRWYIGFGPSYIGTTHGVCIATPWLVILGHIRDLNFNSRTHS